MTEDKSYLKRLRNWMFHSVPGMLTCKEIDDYTIDYIDGALPADERRKFTLHLLLCMACRRYLRAYRRTITLCAESVVDSDRPVEDELPESLVDAIVSAGRAKSRRE